MIDIVRIPEDRKGALIGRDGSAKRKIEKEAAVTLEIYENEVEIDGDDINVIAARDIIKAVGRGFSPNNALKLLNDEYRLIIINVADYTSRNLEVVLARVIGTNGKTKKIIEEYTRTKVCVYGKTVSIIGTYHDMPTATEAVEMLIEGAMHRTVYKYLEDVKKKMKKESDV